LGHNEVDRKARGGALLENLTLDRWRGSRNGAAVVATPVLATGDAAAVEDAVRGAGRALAVLAAGTAVLAIPLVLRGAAIHAPTLRPALEMMLVLFCLSAAWLLRAQFVDSLRVRDLLLLSVTLAFGLINLCINALPAAFDLGNGGYLAAANLWGQLFVAGIFAAAATASVDTVLTRPGHAARVGLLLGVGPLLAAGLGGLLMSRLGVRLGLHAGATGAAVRIVLVLATSGLLTYGAAMLARENLRRPDRVVALPSIAGLLLASAALSPLTAHSQGRGEVGAGTAMRLIATALLLSTAVVLERRGRARATKAAALAERRRVARDLHDGIAQDLAFIAAHGEQFATELGEEHPMVVAARRALAVSRSTISELSDPQGATAREALDAVAHELRDRFDVAIAVHAEIDDQVPSATREHLSRIAREAIANAARHGQARNVLVSLQRAEGGLALRVTDDGCGIPVGERGATPEGFGLRSMRERAGALGGTLTVRPSPRGGTELEVLVP
jgi:signal transduction histidine kinase